MANHCVDTRTRTKCSGLRGHQCKGWRCILMCIVVCLSCVVARGLDEDTVFMYPEGDLNVRYGDNLTIWCRAGEDSTAKDLVFMVNGKQLESQIINDTTIMLFKERPAELQTQLYYCMNKKTKRNVIKSVVIGSPPKHVTDFHCISRNMDVLNCSWTTPNKIVFTNYTLTYYFHGSPVKPCVASTVENTLTKYCTWATNSTVAPYRQQMKTFWFSLHANNVFGHNSENFTVEHYSIVKPDPPLHLQNISQGPHSVVLQWSIPNNIADFLTGGVEHRIEYQIAKIDDTSYFRRVNTLGLPPKNKSYLFNLSGLPYAHMQYGIRVYIKPVRAHSEKFWSEFSNLVFYSASEIPGKPPDIAAGAFRQNKYQGYRVVYIYWKQLEEYEEAGANFTYRILVKQGSKDETYFPDKSKSLGFLILDNASLDAMDVYVWSYNEKGSSVNSSHLYIPPESETHSLDLSSFTKLMYENGTYELSWFGINDIDNYTLFWCQHNTTDICNGRINFTVLNPETNKHVINLPRVYRYQFAISANKGSKTSGMIWAKCDISKDEIAMYRFPIVFTDHGAPGKSYVELRWSMDCILKEGIIIGYNISYCPVIQTSSVCDKTDKNHSKYIDDPKQMNTTIENLEPYKTYQFTMALNTIYGLKTIENTTVRITTLEDTPTSPLDVTVPVVRNDSIVISWYRPEHINGHISKIKYVIYNFTNKIREVKYDDKIDKPDVMRRQVTLENLQGFTNYSLSVQACNEGISSCSVSTNPIRLRNCIGPPSKLRNPTFKYSPDLLTWEPPEIFGGTVDQYQIRIIKDDKDPEIINTTDLFYPLSQCQGAVKIEKYQVRAVNFDADIHHGASSDSNSVTLPTRESEDDVMLTYPGEWSDESIVRCDSGSSIFLIFILLGVLAMIGAGCAVLKAYRKIRKMRDIKPEFPKGLFVAPEKDMSKYPFGGLYPTDKEEKPTSDEMLLLPNSKTTPSSPEIKQKEDNCGSSDHTDSTALSDTSQGPIDRQNSTSDEDSHSSLRLEGESKAHGNNAAQGGESSSTGTESSRENSPYFGDSAFKKNKATGYVQPLVNPITGYVQSAPSPFKPPPQSIATQPASTSYVMAGLSPAGFAYGGAPPSIVNHPPTASGYVRPEDAMARSPMNFPTLGPSPTKVFGSESLPTMPTLPPPTKVGTDSSYIQLQSLDALPSQKPTVRNSVPSKPPTASGYVSPGDAVINKHLKNIMSSGQLAEESAILDPAMSPDAYCRFSWSADPANDNLHSLLGNSPTLNSPKN